MLRARKAGVPAPALYFVESETSSIYMERVQGHSIRHLLHEGMLDEAGGAVCGPGDVFFRAFAICVFALVHVLACMCAWVRVCVHVRAEAGGEVRARVGVTAV